MEVLILHSRKEGSFMAENDIKVIALTGGACSGKTTFLNILKGEGAEICGYRMLYIPEAATMLTTHGMSFEDGEIPYQRAILSTQIAMEDAFKQYAKDVSGKFCIVSDRGTLDGAVYCGWDGFNTLMDERALTKEELIGRYDAVIYMVSAAIGAPEHYGKDSNETRREDLREAVQLEFDTMKCWNDHPYIAVIDNEGGKAFPEKISEAMGVLEDILRGR